MGLGAQARGRSKTPMCSPLWMPRGLGSICDNDLSEGGGSAGHFNATKNTRLKAEASLVLGAGPGSVAVNVRGAARLPTRTPHLHRTLEEQLERRSSSRRGANVGEKEAGSYLVHGHNFLKERNDPKRIN